MRTVCAAGLRRGGRFGAALAGRHRGGGSGGSGGNGSGGTSGGDGGQLGLHGAPPHGCWRHRFQRQHQRCLWEASTAAAVWLTAENNRLAKGGAAAAGDPAAPLPRCGLSREATAAYAEVFAAVAEHATARLVGRDDGGAAASSSRGTEGGGRIPHSNRAAAAAVHTATFQPHDPLRGITTLFTLLRVTEAAELRLVSSEVGDLFRSSSDAAVEDGAPGGGGGSEVVDEEEEEAEEEERARLEFTAYLRRLVAPALPVIARRAVPGLLLLDGRGAAREVGDGHDEDELHALATFSYGVQEVVDWHVWDASALANRWRRG